MKETAGSIVILAGSLLLIAGAHFNSVLFWVIGVLMLLDGYFLLTVSVFFPKWLSSYIRKSNTSSRTSNGTAG